MKELGLTSCSDGTLRDTSSASSFENCKRTCASVKP
jgi:hypothetical protein